MQKYWLRRDTFYLKEALLHRGTDKVEQREMAKCAAVSKSENKLVCPREDSREMEEQEGGRTLEAGSLG